MRTQRIVLCLCAILLIAPSGYAGDPPVPIEGKLMVAGWSHTPSFETLADPYAYLMAGSSDSITFAPSIFYTGDVSPLGDEVAYFLDEGGNVCHVWKADLDGSDPVNLTQLAGLAGMNTYPRWSPDGSQIAFVRSDPLPGQQPHEAGYHTWVMNADGTGAHRVTADGAPQTRYPCWSPNGYRLLVELWQLGCLATIDTDGTDMQIVPNVNHTFDWSADGSKVVSDWFERGVVEGEPGTWRQLRIAEADGSNPEVLFEHFIADSTVDVLVGPDPLPLEEATLITWIGPVWPAWSPKGDRIAFLAAFPFEPTGPYVKEQVEVWTYDLESDELTKTTDNSEYEYQLSWNGDNTFSDHTTIVVDNASVEFSGVGSEGLTTIIRDDDPPLLPTGFRFASEFYDIKTTADITGPISLCMTYRDEDVPTGTPEVELAILHYDEQVGDWVDITVFHDPVNNVVCAQSHSLSTFSLSGPWGGHFPDVPPTGYGALGDEAHWAFQEVEACFLAGIVGGYPDGSYQPDWAVGRDQMAVYIARALAAGDENVPTGPAQPSFADVPSNDICYRYIEFAHANAIVFGYPSDGLYHPEYDVDRGQMAVFVARAIATPTGEPGMATYTPTTTTFADVTSDPLDSYQACYKYVEYIAGQGVTQGYPDGLYHPERIVTRGLMAIYVARAFGLL